MQIRAQVRECASMQVLAQVHTKYLLKYAQVRKYLCKTASAHLLTCASTCLLGQVLSHFQVLHLRLKKHL